MLPASQTHEKKAGLIYWASRVLEECDKASAGFAADPVHDLRVAIRRCRSMADGFRSVDPDPAWKQMKRLAKPLFSSLGELRDTQVMLEWVAKLSPAEDVVAQNVMQALGKKETELKEAAQLALSSFDRKHWSALNAHLGQRTDRIPLEGPVFQLLALERWTDARELHRHALRNRSSVAFHQLRIGIKRFRYTVENFLPQRHALWSKDLRQLQDALGEVHDLDVLRTILRTHPGIHVQDRMRWNARLREERQVRLDLYRQKMLGRSSLWNVWRNGLPEGQALEDAIMEKLRTWAEFMNPDLDHSRLVTQLSLQLYDGLSQCGILTNSSRDRRLLEAAALLHEVGRHRDGRGYGGGGHQKRGYRMVTKLNPPLGWTAEDLRSVAVMVRHHRGSLPVTSNSSFVGLPAKRRAQLLPLIGVLRLANAFDDEHEKRVKQVTVEANSEAVLISAAGMQRLSPTAERVARARYLLESVSQRPIMIRAIPAHAGVRRRPAGERGRTQ